jgi:sodium pump decarboxylase gamma subunit
MSNEELFLLGISTAAIGMGIVFMVLIFLSGAIVLQSKLLRSKEKDTSGGTPKKHRIEEAEKLCTTSSGNMIVQGVKDEEILAIIMAVVSDAADIPLHDLKFKSIKAI